MNRIILTPDDKQRVRYYTLSAEIMSEREDYYNILEKTQKGSCDVTGWLVWFLGCHARAIKHSDDMLNGFLQGRVLADPCLGQADGATEEGYQPVVRCRSGWVRGWIDHVEVCFNDACSRVTAYRELDQLHVMGILERVGQGRGVRYELKLHSS